MTEGSSIRFPVVEEDTLFQLNINTTDEVLYHVTQSGIVSVLCADGELRELDPRVVAALPAITVTPPFMAPPNLVEVKGEE